MSPNLVAGTGQNHTPLKQANIVRLPTSQSPNCNLSRVNSSNYVILPTSGPELEDRQPSVPDTETPPPSYSEVMEHDRRHRLTSYL